MIGRAFKNWPNRDDFAHSMQFSMCVRVFVCSFQAFFAVYQTIFSLYVPKLNFQKVACLIGANESDEF